MQNCKSPLDNFHMVWTLEKSLYDLYRKALASPLVKWENQQTKNLFNELGRLLLLWASEPSTVILFYGISSENYETIWPDLYLAFLNIFISIEFWIKGIFWLNQIEILYSIACIWLSVWTLWNYYSRVQNKHRTYDY